jgi:hypothetical protein
MKTNKVEELVKRLDPSKVYCLYYLEYITIKECSLTAKNLCIICENNPIYEFDKNLNRYSIYK